MAGISQFKRTISKPRESLVEFHKEIIGNFGPDRIDPMAILKELGIE